MFEEGHSHFQEMSGGKINATELVASLICKKETLVEGIRYAQETVNGSLTLLLMTKDGIYAARDRYGRTPVVVGKKEEAYCVSFENSAYINLGYEAYEELGRRDRSDYSGKRGTVGSSGKRDEDLFFFMGLLWLSDFLLRRRQCRRNAL